MHTTAPPLWHRDEPALLENTERVPDRASPPPFHATDTTRLHILPGPSPVRLDSQVTPGRFRCRDLRPRPYAVSGVRAPFVTWSCSADETTCDQSFSVTVYLSTRRLLRCRCQLRRPLRTQTPYATPALAQTISRCV